MLEVKTAEEERHHRVEPKAYGLRTVEVLFKRRTLAEARFSSEIMLDKMEAVFRAAIASNNATHGNR